MFCKKCGMQLGDDAAFCTRCGAFVKDTQNDAPVQNSSAYPVYTDKGKGSTAAVIVSVSAAAVILIGVIIIAALLFVRNKNSGMEEKPTLSYSMESETVQSEEISPTEGDAAEVPGGEEGSSPVTAPPAVVVVPPAENTVPTAVTTVQPAATKEKQKATTVKTTTTVQTTAQTEQTSEYAAYLDVIAQHSRDRENLALYSSYCLYDINHDGIYELFVHTGACEAAGEYHVYTLNEQGASVHIGELCGGHTFLTEKDGKIHTFFGHQGYQDVSEIKMIEDLGSWILITESVYEQSGLSDYAPFGTAVKEYDLSDKSAVLALG